MVKSGPKNGINDFKKMPEIAKLAKSEYPKGPKAASIDQKLPPLANLGVPPSPCLTALLENWLFLRLPAWLDLNICGCWAGEGGVMKENAHRSKKKLVIFFLPALRAGKCITMLFPPHVPPRVAHFIMVGYFPRELF